MRNICKSAANEAVTTVAVMFACVRDRRRVAAGVVLRRITASLAGLVSVLCSSTNDLTTGRAAPLSGGARGQNHVALSSLTSRTGAAHLRVLRLPDQ